MEGMSITVNIYTNELQTAGMSYRLHSVRKSSLSAVTYLEVSKDGEVIEDRYIGASHYMPHAKEGEEPED